MDDRQLIARVLDGDMGAARELYDAHVDQVYRAVGRIVGDRETAQECTQETFVRAFRALRGFRGDAALGTWLRTIAVSVALDAARRRRTREARAASLEAAEVEDVGATRRAESEPDLKARMAQAIAALPEIYRTVFVMYDVEGYTHPEIGAALGVPVGTSKARLFHARAKLREALADFAADR